jgi:O-Antigen ligase
MSTAPAYIRNTPRTPVIGPVTICALAATCVGLVIIGLYGSQPIAGVIYAAFFACLTWVRPDLAFLVMFATAPLNYDLGGGPVKMALSDISLTLAFPILLARKLLSDGKLAVNPLRWPIWAYFAICAVSIAINQVFAASIVSMLQMMVYLVIAIFVFSNCTRGMLQLERAFLGFIFTNVVLSVAAIVMHSDYVLGLHKNALGAEVGYGLIVCTELWIARSLMQRPKRWLTMALCLLSAGLVMSLSRGAWLGTAAGILVVFAIRRRYRLLFRSLAIMVPVICLCWFSLPAQLREYASDFGANSYSARARFQSLDFARERFLSSPVFGVGVGLRKTYDATNLVMSTLAESGVLGLLAFLSIFVAFAYMAYRAWQTLKEDDPAISLLSIGAALAMCSFVHGCLDHYWSRGIFPVFASMGMAIYAYNRSLQVRGGTRRA